MKGQIFIVVSVFIAIALLVMAMSSAIIPENPDYLQNYFTNIRTELIETASQAIIDQEDVGNALDEYISFSEQVLEKKGYETTITYVENVGDIELNIYLEKNGEYYSDTVIVERSVYT